RRRHTRFSRDWSSDVCSSDLATDVTVPIDIPPAANRATLTLANGDVIMLDSASDGQLAVQQGTRILKEADRIIYEGNRTPANERSEERRVGKECRYRGAPAR